MSDLEAFRERYRRSLEAFIKGDAGPQKSMWSRSEDVTLANPLGPPVRGFERVVEAIDRAVATVREGDGLTYEVISSYETADLAYDVALQGGRMRLGDAAEMVHVSLRVTSIFRREDDGWKLVHRHADPITQARPIGSLAGPSSGPA